MTEPASVLDRMEWLKEARNESIDFDDMESVRRVTDARHDFDELMTKHEEDLIAVVRAALEVKRTHTPIHPEAESAPFARMALWDALAPLLTRDSDA